MFILLFTFTYSHVWQKNRVKCISFFTLYLVATAAHIFNYGYNRRKFFQKNHFVFLVEKYTVSPMWRIDIFLLCVFAYQSIYFVFQLARFLPVLKRMKAYISRCEDAIQLAVNQVCCSLPFY